jgi:hypothetical protein
MTTSVLGHSPRKNANRPKSLLRDIDQKRFARSGTACADSHWPRGSFTVARFKLNLSQPLAKDATMPRVKQASKQTRTTKAAVTAVGAAGLGLSLPGSAMASMIPTADVSQSDNISPNQRFVLSEEEMTDVSLATFHIFDKENVGSEMQLAAVVVRSCRGCGGCRGCRVWRGCRCGGCGGCGGCCARWGRCRIC